MTYESFAYWYDALMSEAPYDEWKAFVERKVRQYGGADAKRVVDVGCGTGELAVRLAKDGFFVTGVDLSENMLAVAQEKAERERVSVGLFQQNMTELDVPPVDIVVIFCDSLNYLLTETDVMQTFRRVYTTLQEGGLFLFDVHSIYKMELFQGETFADSDESISYIWQCEPLDTPHTVAHELTFFVQTNRGLYERYDESHVQRTFTQQQYEQWLADAGFTVLEVCADFTDSAPCDTSERIFFVAKK
ncbi:class I SAM-dependent DNA methyltransferase [Anoxybacteroides amylolyticum]|uniref:Methyltransferase type 12 n=1 Tax=Anoxybacteroides amylolyticum TaxID=294699 RepID=A0A160F6X9_9BACL|nr:class I SAM-dependent methyltransferase [Anoxybacillus amylolyticus]ANB61735.1 methyltransferase type 12 [Anoxybacillus amylolyticus]